MAYFSIGSAFSSAWETFKVKPWSLMGILLLFSGISLAIGLIETLLTGSTIVLGLQFTLIRSGVSAFGQMLFIKMGLNIHYKSINETGVYPDVGTWMKIFGASILYSLLIIIGLILLIIPGIYFSVKYVLYTYVIVDQDQGVIDSFSEAGNLAKGNWWKLFLLSIITGALSFSGLLLLGVGVIFTSTLSQLIWMHAYLQLKDSARDPEIQDKIQDWLDRDDLRNGVDVSTDLNEVEEVEDVEVIAPGRSETDLEDLEL